MHVILNTLYCFGSQGAVKILKSSFSFHSFILFSFLKQLLFYSSLNC